MASTFQLVTPWVSIATLDAALYYVRYYQWPVFPLRGKEPLTSRGFYDATRQEAQVRQWWQTWPDANIGMPTGEGSGVVVLDVDAEHGGFASLSAMQERPGYEPLPATRKAISGGGGLHLYYAYPKDRPIGNKAQLGHLDGIDIRGQGGYIVLPPSLHASGNRYLWLDESPPAPFPAFFFDLATPPRRPPTPPQAARAHVRREASTFPQSGNDYLERALRKCQAGTRHKWALWLACRLIEGTQLSAGEAEAVMLEYVRRVPAGDHPYTEDDALGCLDWALTHAA
jgi:Bifunctional DNA primase/polymerase, N-terminal